MTDPTQRSLFCALLLAAAVAMCCALECCGQVRITNAKWGTATGQVESSDPIAATNRMDWTAAGVRGGIPQSFTTYTNFTTGSYSDGQLQAAINAASALSQTNSLYRITFSDGTYTIGADITLKSNVTLRGTSTNTVFDLSSGSQIIIGGNYGYNRTVNHIVGGVAARGTSTVTLSNSVTPGSDLLIGGIVAITELNDTNQASPFYVHPWGYESGTPNFQGGYDENVSPSGHQVRGQLSRITAASGTSLTFDPPLASDFTNAARVEYVAGPTTDWVGLENLKFKTFGDVTGYYVQGAQNCWITNVWFDCAGSENNTVHYYWAINSEVRGCSFKGNPGDGSPVAIRFGVNTGLNRIEDNWFEHVAWSVLHAGRGWGNVIAYNFMGQATNGSPGTQLTADIWNHGNHPDFYLIEGNKGGKLIHADNIHGSGSRWVLLRNHARGCYTNKLTSYGGNAIAIDEFHSWFSLVGNVLGWPGTNTSAGWLNNAGTGGAAALLALNFSGYDATDNGGQYALSRALITGNWNVYSNAVQYDANGSFSITNSYLYTTKPSYFGNLAWPPIGPDATGYYTNLLPAEARYYGIAIP